MATSPATPHYRTLIAAASLIVGPLLMTIGDLFHPEERMDTAEQIAILADQASRWYAAHLLLFIGMMLYVPGLLALSSLAAARKPAAGYAARVLSLIGAAAFTSIFLGEMLVGRFLADGGDTAAAKGLLDTMFSGPIAAAVLPAVLAFVVGTAAFAIPLLIAGGKLRWTAALISTGVLFILAEILSAEVVLSQIGNFLIFCGSAIAAWLIIRGETGETASPP